MSNSVNVIVIAEGASEQNFAESVLAPYLGTKGIFLRATQISKKGQKGGDVKFERAKRDIVNFLRQRQDNVVATFVDYYGVKQWPGLEQVRALHRPAPDVIAKTMNEAAVAEIRNSLPDDICAQLWMRTSYIRKGVLATFGKIDAGFEGTLTLGAYNATDDVIEVPIGDRFCQMVFETLSSPSAKSYEKRSGHYQGQTGITLDPIKRQ